MFSLNRHLKFLRKEVINAQEQFSMFTLLAKRVYAIPPQNYFLFRSMLAKYIQSLSIPVIKSSSALGDAIV